MRASGTTSNAARKSVSRSQMTRGEICHARATSIPVATIQKPRYRSMVGNRSVAVYAPARLSHAANHNLIAKQPASSQGIRGAHTAAKLPRLRG